MATNTYGLASWDKFFNYGPMKLFTRYMQTFNMETEVVSGDDNVYDIESTGTKGIMLNGVIYTAAVDAAMDISAGADSSTGNREVVKAAWATATAYVIGDIKWNDGVRYRCIQAHTSGATTEPGAGDIWAAYWVASPHEAVWPNGTSIADASERWFLVTSEYDGTLGIWEAGDSALTTAGAIFKCPVYCPFTYAPVAAVLYANSAGDTAADLVGSGTTADFDTYGTFIQLTGPVLPHPDNMENISF